MKTLQNFKKEKVELKSVNGGTVRPNGFSISGGTCIPSAPGGSDCGRHLGGDIDYSSAC